MRDQEFLAVDAVPGNHLLRFCAGGDAECVETDLDLTEGQVTYILGDTHGRFGSIVEYCRQDCGHYVLEGKQLAALPPPGSNIPGF